jgi:predicted RNA binding protein YcfA (HicA-like mRNA interferase family)
VKRKYLIKKIADAGCILLRHDKCHDFYKNPKTGKKQSIPGHSEINENLAKHIIKELT